MTYPHNPIEIYQSADGQTQVEVHLDTDTVWLSQAQMATLFGRTQAVISYHINRAIREGEINKKNNTQKKYIASADRQVTCYDLETVISVSYRIKSPQGIAFRRWITARLKDYLYKGYALNQQRLQQNAAELEQALQLFQKIAASPELTLDAGRGLIDIASRYTQTFLWLQQYDEGLLQEPQGESGGILPTAEEARAVLHSLKQLLLARGEATELFAHERNDGLAALLGNLEQSIFGAPAYPTIESKAAHLLYFVVKNHPFADGNKRSGAFLFIDFLHRNRRLLRVDGTTIINDADLTALTLLVAESAPAQKDTLIRLIMHMLQPQGM